MRNLGYPIAVVFLVMSAIALSWDLGRWIRGRPHPLTTALLISTVTWVVAFILAQRRLARTFRTGDPKTRLP
ncbi:MAG: hypothetical protein ACRYFW_02830 [Janthinobacterium lividum]